MIHGIHHTAISTRDLERALGFYRDLLGAVVVTDFEWPAGLEVAVNRSDVPYREILIELEER